MSSSVAINRRISRDSGSGNTTDMNNSKNFSYNEAKVLSGTSIQQHYQILNFHEKRLQQVFQQVHVLTNKLNKLEPEMNLRLHRLEQNASLRRHISSLQNDNKDTNSVSLEVNEIKLN